MQRNGKMITSGYCCIYQQINISRCGKRTITIFDKYFRGKVPRNYFGGRIVKMGLVPRCTMTGLRIGRKLYCLCPFNWVVVSTSVCIDVRRCIEAGPRLLLMDCAV